MKLTKRKAFNFFRSYYDVYNELSDKDKISFMDALLDRQFLGVKPTNLKGIAKFAYISQTNSIDSQVKGYETKTKSKLGDSKEIEGVTHTPTVGGAIGGEVQEKGEVEEEEKEQYVTPTQKTLVFIESEYETLLVEGFRNFVKFLENTKEVKNIPSQITIDNYKKLCDEYGRDLLWKKITELDNWLIDPNVAKGKKKKKSVYHLMVNTWLKNGY
jgi:hypothetical protein